MKRLAINTSRKYAQRREKQSSVFNATCFGAEPQQIDVQFATIQNTFSHPRIFEMHHPNRRTLYVPRGA